ncbi:MAG: CobD/CbiB family protein [Burkholderiales bacterium]|nr:CobD/CbiB family protein [Burkholderiales bacterium]
MTFFSLIVALLLEQARPFDGKTLSFMLGYFDWLKTHLTTGESRHSVLAWMIAVMLPTLAVGTLTLLFHRFNPILGWAWNVFVLYLTMGFRQFSHAYTGIDRALKSGDLQKARELLGVWRGASAAEFNSEQIARVSIEQGLIFSHTYVFGVIFFFAALGPMGAVLYRIATVLGEEWNRFPEETGYLGKFSAQAFEIIDWIPSRLTAVSFAIVGDFEDALYCWRTQALSWRPVAHGILLASGAGALGVRLGETLPEDGLTQYRPLMGIGDEADGAYMQSTVGLIWRSLLLWLLLILLLTIANLIG